MVDLSTDALEVLKERSETLFLLCTAYCWRQAREAAARVEALRSSAHRQSHPLLSFLPAFLNEYRDRAAVQEAVEADDNGRLLERIHALDEPTGDALLLVADALKRVREFVEGSVKGDEIIFTLSGLKRWRRLFQDSLIMRWSTLGVLWLLEHRVHPRRGAEVWLEIGAGVGGTAYPLIDYGLESETLKEYTFTDVADAFLTLFDRECQKRYSGHRDKIRTMKLDLNAITLEAPCTAVVGTNVIHCANDVVATLDTIGKNLLGGGGHLFVVETTRSEMYRTIFLELFYLFIGDYASIAPHSNPVERGLYSDEEWREIFGRSSLELVEWKQFLPWSSVYLLSANTS